MRFYLEKKQALEDQKISSFGVLLDAGTVGFFSKYSRIVNVPLKLKPKITDLTSSSSPAVMGLSDGLIMRYLIAGYVQQLELSYDHIPLNYSDVLSCLAVESSFKFPVFMNSAGASRAMGIFQITPSTQVYIQENTKFSDFNFVSNLPNAVRPVVLQQFLWTCFKNTVPYRGNKEDLMSSGLMIDTDVSSGVLGSKPACVQLMFFLRLYHMRGKIQREKNLLTSYLFPWWRVQEGSSFRNKDVVSSQYFQMFKKLYVKIENIKIPSWFSSLCETTFQGTTSLEPDVFQSFCYYVLFKMSELQEDKKMLSVLKNDVFVRMCIKEFYPYSSDVRLASVTTLRIPKY